MCAEKSHSQPLSKDENELSPKDTREDP